MPLNGSDLGDEAFLSAYQELRRLARTLTRGRDLPTLNATALVHEAFIRLARSKHFRAESPEHLKHTLARAMKYILLDAARRKSAASRGGGEAAMKRVDLDDPAAQAATASAEMTLAVSVALADLAATDPDRAQAFELQFFGGFEAAEIAAMTGRSEEDVRKLLRRARASLKRLLSDDPRQRSDSP